MLQDYSKLPALPNNAEFAFYQHDCYTWGNYGWLLKSGQVHFDKFSHFIFIDGSVRGPYLPLYAKVRAVAVLLIVTVVVFFNQPTHQFIQHHVA